MDSKYLIPRTLDDPPLIFIWEGDSASIFILFLFFAMLLDMFFVGTFSGILVVKGYVKLKEEGGLGLLQRFAYWHTPSELWLKNATPSYIRELIGG